MFFSGFLTYPIIAGPYVPTVAGPMLLTTTGSFQLVGGAGPFLVLTR